MIRQKSTLLLLITISFFGNIFAMDSLNTNYPYLKKVKSESKTDLDQPTGFYYYSYIFENDKQNHGNIFGIELDISINSNSVALDTMGLKFDRLYTEQTFRRDFVRYVNKILPVSVFNLPTKKWSAGVAYNFALSIGVIGQKPIPGEKVRGIKLMSKGIPGIRHLLVRPWFEESKFFPDLDDTTSKMTISEMDSLRNMCNYYGWTVGPTAPPINFIATTWCDTLLSYARQSMQLGWLKAKRDDDREDDERSDDEIVKNIEKRIEKAKKELIKGDSAKARQELEKLVKKVEKLYKHTEEAEKEKRENDIVMTSEAYALLKYNTEYLIDRLPREKGKKKGEKEK